MARDWRKLAVAALAAAAVAMTCGLSVESQAQTSQAQTSQAQTKTKAAKKAKAKEAEPEEAEDAAKTPPKKKKQDPAEAQRAIEAAVKLLEAGKAEQAGEALTAVLTGGNLPPAIMAKALFYRGIAYRQQKKPAQAIADLTSALWLKGGLGEGDRANALKQRASAYQEAGLSEASETTAAEVPGATQQSAGGTTTGAQQAPAQAKQTSSIWNPFSGWFGGASAPPPAASQSAPGAQTTASIPVPQPASAPPSRAPSVASAWASNTEVRGSSAAPAEASPAAARPAGRFRVQLGMVRTQGEAQAIADKAKREHEAVLAAREPEIDQTVVGNMGSFYRVRVGPFATQADGQAVCAKLKGTGFDCLVVTQ